MYIAGTTTIQTDLNEVYFGKKYKFQAECLDYSGILRIVNIKRKLEVTIISRPPTDISSTTLEQSSIESSNSDSSTQTSLVGTSQRVASTSSFFTRSVTPSTDLRTTSSEQRTLETTHQRETFSSTYYTNSVAFTSDVITTLSTQRSLDTAPGTTTMSLPYFSNSIGPTSDRTLQITPDRVTTTPPDNSNSMVSTERSVPSTERSLNTTSITTATISSPNYSNSMETVTDRGTALSTQGSIEKGTTVLSVTDSQNTLLNSETTSQRQTSTVATSQPVSSPFESSLTNGRKSSYSTKSFYNLATSNNEMSSTIEESAQTVDIGTSKTRNPILKMSKAQTTTTEIQHSNTLTAKAQSIPDTSTKPLATSTVTDVKMITNKENGHQSYFAEPMNTVIFSMLGLTVAFVVLSVARSCYNYGSTRQNHNSR